MLKSTHCLLNLSLSCSLIIQSCSEVAAKGLTTEALFYSNKLLTRRFYRISEQLRKRSGAQKKKNYKNFTKRKKVNPLLAVMHYLPLPALLVHVHPRVPERLAEEESMQWDLRRKGT